MPYRWLGVILLGTLPWTAAAQLPADGEFQVNTYTTGTQSAPVIGMAAGGSFVVIWESNTQDGDDFGVFGQRYDAAGVPVGGEFRVNTYTTNAQRRPAMAMNARGEFVVVWESYGAQDGDGQGIFGQRFDASGQRRGGEFQVNTYTTSNEIRPAVALGPGGTFVVAWHHYDFPSNYAIFAQRFDAAGARLGSEFRVNTYTTSFQRNPSVAVDGSGDFVVVWQSGGQDGDGYGIFGQRYDAAGQLLGSEFQVNTYTTDGQRNPAVSAAPAGHFVVVWQSYGQDGDGYGIFARRYDAAGQPQGAEVQVNTFTTDDQQNPAVAMDGAGNFVVVWDSFSQEGVFFRGVYGQRMDAAGVPRGSEFHVNTFLPDVQAYPAVATDGAGNFVVAWDSNTQDGSNFGIFAQRYGGLLPVALAVDATGNGVLEPGETVSVAPSWRNVNGASQTFTGTASQLTGPGGATYTLLDPGASYSTVASGAIGTCGSDCFVVSVSNPATRPALHWDLTVLETLGPPVLGQTKVWTLHVGASFTDVPTSQLFYRFIETLLHSGVTAGCTATTYCPDGTTTREQMAVFLLRAKEGAGFAPPACTTAPFPDVPCASPFAPWVKELVARGITSGCGGGLYCPTNPVTREQMAVFLLKTGLGAGFVPLACITPTFTDVPCSSPFAPWVQELVARGVTAGCGGSLYCPTDPVTRGQMAVFLTKMFGLTLYGP
jgi:hypothetical protein